MKNSRSGQAAGAVLITLAIILVIGLTLPVAGLSAYSCISPDAQQTASEQTVDGSASTAEATDSASTAAETSSSSK